MSPPFSFHFRVPFVTFSVILLLCTYTCLSVFCVMTMQPDTILFVWSVAIRTAFLSSYKFMCHVTAMLLTTIRCRELQHIVIPLSYQQLVLAWSDLLGSFLMALVIFQRLYSLYFIDIGPSEVVPLIRFRHHGMQH